MTDTTSSKKTAGAFDIRSIIGLLLTTYGVILTAMGLFADTDEDRTGGVNANLWAGLALLVAGLGFLAWARWKPVVVPEDGAAEGSSAGPLRPVLVAVSEEAGAQRAGHGSRPGGLVELGEDVGDVSVHGVGAEGELGGDLVVAQAARDQLQHLPLPR